MSTSLYKRRSDSFNVQVTDRTGQEGNVEQLLGTLRSTKERISLVEAKTLDVQRSNVPGHLRILRSKKPGFLFGIAEDVKDGLAVFCRRLAASVSNHFAAR